MSALKCYACSEPALIMADARNALCGDCEPVREHVVSMQNTATSLVAVCQCGWSYICSSNRSGYGMRERAVQAHWRSVAQRTAL